MKRGMLVGSVVAGLCLLVGLSLVAKGSAHQSLPEDFYKDPKTWQVVAAGGDGIMLRDGRLFYVTDTGPKPAGRSPIPVDRVAFMLSTSKLVEPSGRTWVRSDSVWHAFYMVY